MKQNNYFIYNGFIVNEGKIFRGDVLVQHGKIVRIIKPHSPVEDLQMEDETLFVDATNLYLLPGVIDTHVHFREPGLTHKGTYFSESKAAVAGGVTSVMDMPNVIPQTTSIALWEERMKTAQNKFFTNYAFYIAATNTNLEELQQIDKNKVCGIKLFLGSSTGNMLLSDENTLEQIFQTHTVPLVAHCEDEAIIQRHLKEMENIYGEDIPINKHPFIRSEEACYLSSQKAVSLAKKYDSQLHILHLSTTKELSLFSQTSKITAEVCPSYLFLDDTQYDVLGTKMKCNPAIKTAYDRQELLKAVGEQSIQTIGSDHAPHTEEEKNNTYLKAPSGIPMVQHSLVLMLELYHQEQLKLQTIVEKMSHNPAKIFQIEKRGFIREGYFADMVLIDLKANNTILKENIYYKCQWSPFEGMEVHSKVEKTFVNGEIVYDRGVFIQHPCGKPLDFER